MDNSEIQRVKAISRSVREQRKAEIDRVIRRDSTSIWRCPVCWSIRVLVAGVLVLAWFLWS
ncbi:MAG: hypothetical protein EBU42_00975 [Synechococcus sp.]|nr:hypothetical protein [Synechococcus sp.]